MNTNPTNLVQKALNQNQLTDLLLGTPEYSYLPKYSPSQYSTDLADLLGVLYDTCPSESRAETALKLETAFKEIVGTYDGTVPCAMVILFETLEQKRNKRPLGLPLENLASVLKKSIETFRARLAKDKTGGGVGFADGLLGELRRLNTNVVELGGPSFFN